MTPYGNLPDLMFVVTSTIKNSDEQLCNFSHPGSCGITANGHAGAAGIVKVFSGAKQRRPPCNLTRARHMRGNDNINFRSWPEFEARLNSLGLFRMKPGLERISAVLDAMKLKRPPFYTAQIAGTNGKGSTVSFMASIAREHGFKAGVHSSPHFVSVRERVRIFRPGSSLAGDLLPENAWLEAANAVMANGGEELSYFELVTAVALKLMQMEKVDIALMETGLGGLFDATTALEADLVVFVPFALDHMNVLGPTLADISRDKAGAVRYGKPALSAVQKPEAAEALKHEAQSKNAALEFVRPEALPEEFLDGRAALGLKGGHQAQNAALALAAWRKSGLGKDLPETLRAKAERDGLARAFLPGRMQFIQPLPDGAATHPAMLLDGGHNPHGLAALGHSLARLGISPAAVIFTCMEDKEPEALVPHLRALSTGPVFVPGMGEHPRAMKPEALAKVIGLSAEPCRDLPEALKKATALVRERLPECMELKAEECSHPVLICGSLYLLGEFFALYPRYLAEPPLNISTRCY